MTQTKAPERKPPSHFARYIPPRDTSCTGDFDAVLRIRERLDGPARYYRIGVEPPVPWGEWAVCCIVFGAICFGLAVL